MKDEKELLRCDECHEVLKTSIPDQDTRGYVWCRKCGLVYEPEHEMGRSFGGLRDYMVHNRLNDDIEEARVIYKIEGLAKARLWVSKRD